MEALTDPTVAKVVLCMGKQLGKSNILLNALLYVIDVAPANILFKAPTIDTVKRFSQKVLAPTVAEMKRIRDKIRDHRSRDSGNTIRSKLFPGGSLSMVGANSASDLRQLTCKWIIQDEIDSDQNNKEGDPVAQADGRAERFPDAVFAYASTPTVKGGSRIWKLLEDSDWREWHCDCPRCNHRQTLKWANVKWTWPDADGKLIPRPEDACYVCEGCNAELSDFERVRMVMQGRWVPRYPHRTTRGYHLSGLYGIMGKKKTLRSFLHEWVLSFLEATKDKDDPGKLQFWINTFLAEPYEIQLDRISADPVYLRRENYGPALPKGVLVLTCAVDTQADRLEYLIKGWGLGEESWGIETGRLMGNPFQTAVWKQLDKILNREWDHPILGKLKIIVTVIDSGGQADEEGFRDPVYKFVRPRQPMEFGPGVYAIKGSSKTGAPLVSNRRPKKGICLKLVGTVTAKLTFHQRLKLDQSGPRFCHYPVGYGFDEEFFAQLGAEAARQVKKNGYLKIEFHKLRARNEALDMEGYSQAALEIMHADLLAIAARAKKLDKEKAEDEKPAPSPTAPRPIPRDFSRRRLVKPRFGSRRFA